MALLTLKKVNAELARRGHNAGLEKASDYFYFKGGEATDWLDRTVRVPTVNSLNLAQWMEEFERLRKLNAAIASRASAGRKPSRSQKPAK